MNLRDLCFHLRNRRRMYLLDDRFSTAVAFVEGFNAACRGSPLQGFQEYVTKQILGDHQSSLHWSYIIASTVVPTILDGEMRIDQIPSELEIGLTGRMVDLIERYAENGGTL